MEELLKKLQDIFTVFGMKVIAAVAILIIGRWIAGLLRRFIRKLMTKRKVDDSLVSFVSNLVFVGLMTFVILAVLGQFGIQTGSFIAVVGAAGLAIGFALQGALGNFAAGVLMLIFRPFKVGDYIEGAGVAGIVEEIELFTTQLKTPDNKTVIIPNAKLTGDNITNYSTKDCRRVDLVFGVSYTDDLKKVKDVIADVLAQDERILKEPELTIGLLELADSSVNFAVRPWVKTADYWPVLFDTNEAMKKRFDAEGISIPFPQSDVHLYQAKE